MLALTPPPDRAIPVLWQNFIRTFNVPGRLDTVPSAHSRSLAEWSKALESDASAGGESPVRAPVRAATLCPNPAKLRDKTAGSLFTRVYTLVEFSQTKRCFFSFLKQNIQIQMIHQHHYPLDNTINISLKIRYLIILFFLFFCLFCLRSTNAIEHRHWLLASVSIASVLSEHHLFVYVRHI